MAPTLLLSSGDTTNGTSYVSGSISPTANALQLGCLSFSYSTSADPPPPTSVVGAGIPWRLARDGYLAYKQTGGTRLAIALYYGRAASPSSGAVTITFAQTMAGCRWQFVEWPDVWLAQVATNRSDSVANGASLTATLGAPQSTGSRGFLVQGGNNTTGWTVGSWTSLSETAHTNPTESLQTAHSGASWSASATVTNGSGATTSGGVIAIELRDTNPANVAVAW